MPPAPASPTIESMLELDFDAADVRAWAVDASGDPHVDAATWTVVTVGYGSPSPTTGGLYRIVGSTWSLFVKVVQSFRHWDLLDALPAAMRDAALATTAWRYEADLYSSPLASILPGGLRLPRVHAVRERPDDRIVVIMEDVAVDPTPWTRDRYAVAAHALGRLDVRLTTTPGLPTSELHDPGAFLRHYVESRIVPLVATVLADDTTWAHPLLAGENALRADLTALGTRIPALLDSLGTLPHVRTHGDATPHNLLVPRSGPTELVVIDWAMGAVAPAGEELGQLLIGGAHDGTTTVDDLVTLRELVVPAYTAGLAAEGLDVAAHDVRLAMDTSITLRSAFSALPLERLAEPIDDELARLFTQRVALTRHLVEVGLSLGRVSALRGGT